MPQAAGSRRRDPILRGFEESQVRHGRTGVGDEDATTAAAARTALVDTLDWLEGVVIGYNLCPFAEAPMLRDQLSIEVVSGDDETEILARVLGACLELRTDPNGDENETDETDTDPRGTALVVCPDLHPTDFEAYLEVYDVLVEGVLPDHDPGGSLQIAPFHPMFVFGDSDGGGNDDDDNIDDDAIDHYTNRSPHPTFHVLREAEVARAVTALEGNAERVWKRNVDLLRALEELFVDGGGVEEEEEEYDDGDDDDDEGGTGRGGGTLGDPAALLRTVFLRGKTGLTPSAPTEEETADLPSSSSRGGCPFTEPMKPSPASVIEAYDGKVQRLLRDFRKRVY